MKKLYTVLLLAGATALSGMAQSKFDAAGMLVMDTYAARLKNPNIDRMLTGIPGADIALKGRSDARASVFVKLNEGATAADIEVRGFDIISDFGDIVIAAGTMDDIQALSECDFVRSMSFGQERRPMLDKARAAIGVDKIHAGTDLNKAYTGAGVITGLMDTGLDALHANFCNPDGTTRFSRIWRSGTFAGRFTEYTPENISSYTPDSRSESHATHTLGCMAGGFNQAGANVSTIKPGGNPIRPSIELRDDVNNPFYGVAIGSEIVAGCGQLADANTIKVAENTLAYAKAQGKPAVFNLSIGSVIGPHDNTPLVNQTLERLGKEMIICLSAGNEGDIDMSIDKTLTASETEFMTLFGSANTRLTGVSGLIDFWSDSSTPFEVTAFIYNTTTKEILGDVINVTGTEEKTYEASASDPNFSKTFSNATLTMRASNNSGTNKRFNVYTYAYLPYNTASTGNRNRNLMLGFKVKGTPGQRITVTTNSENATFIDNSETDKFVKGSGIYSINDMAGAHNLIVVGAFNSRVVWPMMTSSGSYRGVPGLGENKVSGFSSYGTMPDGRNLPDICAPGCAIVSSVSSYSVASGYLSQNECSAIQEFNDRTNHWQYMQGTSMSSPICAGTIALWLEANPSLTVEDVRTIIKETATVDENVTNSIQWGAGKLNAYDGLKMAIKMASGVNDVAIDGQDKLIVTPKGDNTWELYMPYASGINAELYNLSGIRVANASGNGDTITFSADGIAKGIYVLTANGTESRRIIVR